MLVAKQSFAGEYRGVPYVVAKGQTIDDDHPIALAHPDNFRPIRADISWEHAVEHEVRHVTPSSGPETEQIHDPDLRSPVNEDMKLAYLKERARALGLADYGTKAEIAERINKHLAAD